jgi:hypothetical protein
MKAKFLLIAILTLLTTSLSSCFIKKWFTQPKRYNDHRGVYKDMGLTPDHKAFLEARGMNKHKKHHHKKKKVKTHKLKEDQNKKAAEETNLNADSSAQKMPVEQSMPNGGQVTTDSTGQTTQPAPAPETPKANETPAPVVDQTGQQMLDPAIVPPADQANPAASDGQDGAGDKKGKKKKKSKKAKSVE